MDTQPDAHIYLADQRGCSENEFFRSYHTFNFGRYVEESRKPFGALHLLNDDTLRAGASLSMQVEQPTQVLLIPVVGGLEYKIDLKIESSGDELQTGDFLEPGQAGILSLAAGMSYTVSNPYETETIGFVQVWLATESTTFVPGFRQTDFDLTHKNALLPLTRSGEITDHRVINGFIGRYDGRWEGVYPVKKLANNASPNEVFVFVLKGVFDVADRLLHEKDGLALRYKHDDALAFEALSNEAILVLLEWTQGESKQS